jgi:hypothetical protein
MVGTDTFTPNLRLVKVGGDRKNWNDLLNGNFTSLDAVITSFFAVSSMRGIWANSTEYDAGDAVVDEDTAVVWTTSVDHTSAMLPTTFAEERAANPTYWAVYSAPATNKGAWTTATDYSRNDFILADGSKYAFCLVSHTSGSSFSADLALGYWSVLIDLSIVGSLVLPVLSGVADANKLVLVNPTGSAYIISSMEDALTAGGATSLGIDLLMAASQAAARSVLGLGTAAVADTGTGIGNVLSFAVAAKLPALDGSLLTGVVPSLTNVQTFLGANVALNNVANFFASCEISIGIAATNQTWLILGSACVTDTAGAAAIEVAIYDVTNAAYRTNTVVTTTAASFVEEVSVGYIATITGVTNFQLRCKDLTSTSGQILTSSAATGITNRATWLLGIRLA